MLLNRRRWLVYLTSVIITLSLVILLFQFQENQYSASWLSYKTNTALLNEKIDWHDYKKIIEEKERTGVGEQGKKAYLPGSMNGTKESIFKVNGYNGALSDLISVNRSIPDVREAACRRKKYLKNLDPVSVIVPFHNDHFSVLLRTCWSIINRTPASLIHEIILVDDASTKIELKDQLDDYAKKHWPKVSIVRLPERSGLIRGKLAGAKKATAKTLVFLDSHSELNVNWLPPLLEPIAIDYRTCTFPIIDSINYETFSYNTVKNARGIFNFYFYYTRIPLHPEELEHPAEPYMTPIMNGGYFAMSAKFFWELGAYDPGLTIWGAEQFELSFKIWMCGGVIEVWMDEYGKYVYRQYPRLRKINPGDLREQKALRKKLNCKSFKWFMQNVAYDVFNYYPPIEPSDFAYGEFRNIGEPNLCLDGKEGSIYKNVIVDICQKDNPSFKGKQMFSLSWRKDIRLKEMGMCLDVFISNNNAPVTFYPCHGERGHQLWRYDIANQWLMHESQCLDMDKVKKKVFVTKCDTNSATQKWRIEHVNMTAMMNWENPLKNVPELESLM